MFVKMIFLNRAVCTLLHVHFPIFFTLSWFGRTFIYKLNFIPTQWQAIGGCKGCTNRNCFLYRAEYIEENTGNSYRYGYVVRYGNFQNLFLNPHIHAHKCMEIASFAIFFDYSPQ